MWEKRHWESPYCYVGNNPISRIDKNGYYWIEQNMWGNYYAYAWPLGGAMTFEAISVAFPLFGGFAVTMVKRGFGDNATKLSDDLLYNVVPAKKYARIMGTLVGAESVSEAYSQWKLDRKVFGLALQLGLADPRRPGNVMSIDLKKMVEKIYAENDKKDIDLEVSLDSEMDKLKHFYTE